MLRSVLATGALWVGLMSPALGQGISDARVLLNEVGLTLDGMVVGKLPAGATVVVLDTNDALLFSGIGKTGWFPREAAVTLSQGLEHFDRAIQKSPHDARAFVGRANIYFRQNDNVKAIADYDEAIRLDPRDPEPFRWRGWAWKRQGDDAKALADLNEAIRLDPGDAPSWRIRGAVYSAQKNFQECRANYDRAIELDPFDADLFNHRAVLLAKCPDKSFRDGAQAVKDGTRACELANWKTFHYILNLAVAYAEAGDMVKADARLEQALKMAPKGSREQFERTLEPYRQAKQPSQSK
jgi:Tfp pilus assembly protein PilF